MPVRPRKPLPDVARDASREPQKPRKKNPAAVALGKLGASKGGKARAASLTSHERSAIARKAAKKRWGSGPKAG